MSLSAHDRQLWSLIDSGWEDYLRRTGCSRSQALRTQSDVESVRESEIVAGAESKGEEQRQSVREC
jgi:hypothetical protein